MNAQQVSEDVKAGGVMERTSEALRLSRWIEEVEGSSTVALNSQAQMLKRQGRDIINLTAGEPEFKTPESIREAAHRAIDEGKTHYTPTSGIPELREAVAELLGRRTGRPYRAEEVVVTAGAKFAIYITIAALVEPGDEVLIPAPYWVSYPAIVKMFGGVPVPVWAGLEKGYKVDVDDLERAASKRTRGLIFNSPSNPTGAVYSRGETEALAHWAQQRDLWILSDEIYAELRFRDEPYFSIASVDDDLRHRTVIVDGTSKAYAMTGWRVGWLAANKPLAAATTRVMGQTTSCATSIAQYAALAAVTGPQAEVAEMTAEFQRRRDLTYAELKKIPGLGVTNPDGAFYFFLDVRKFLGRSTPDGKAVDDAEALCSYLLDSAGLALVPGEGFGAPGFMRLSFSPDIPVLRDAVGRLAPALGSLK